MGILGREFNAAEIVTNGNPHKIKFEQAGGKYALYVDGILRETFKPSHMLSSIFGDLGDYEFSIDGASVVIAMRFGRMRVAVNGVYIDNASDFIYVKPLPKWAAVFVAAIIIPPFVMSGSILDIIAALCCVYACTHFILKNPDLKADTFRRIMYCVGITAASWAMLAVFWFMERR